MNKFMLFSIKHRKFFSFIKIVLSGYIVAREPKALVLMLGVTSAFSSIGYTIAMISAYINGDKMPQHPFLMTFLFYIIGLILSPIGVYIIANIEIAYLVLAFYLLSILFCISLTSSLYIYLKYCGENSLKEFD